MIDHYNYGAEYTVRLHDCIEVGNIGMPALSGAFVSTVGWKVEVNACVI